MTPYIPPQCYAKTEGQGGAVYNPCYVCHQEPEVPNYINDADLQLEFSFPAAARENPYTNLFVDRRAAIAKVSDDEILTYVRESNYFAPDGSIALGQKLKTPPADWDVDADGRWSGFTPDVAFDFDAQGFDRDRTGKDTGWRAFTYYPLPGGFFPTSGSFGDAMIRLPRAYRVDATEQPNRLVYITNLAILESLLKRKDVAIDPTDEKLLEADLDGDGKMGTAERIAYRWKPGRDHGMQWVGKAGRLMTEGKVKLAAGLYPAGTEFAHTVRYLDVVNGVPRPAARLKELRYMVKTGWLNYGTLQQTASREAQEKELDPDVTRRFSGDAEHGIGNRSGWQLHAFIEGEKGALRPQTREEHAFCIGCHSGLGATDDGVFSFSRKLPASSPQRGFLHWSQYGAAALPEPKRVDGEGEYAHYLRHAGGSDFRDNPELYGRFFDALGNLRDDAAAELSRDVSALLLPSPARALALDKAYREVVREQSFTRGRDAVISPRAQAHRTLPADVLATGVREPLAGSGRPRRIAQGTKTQAIAVSR